MTTLVVQSARLVISVFLFLSLCLAGVVATPASAVASDFPEYDVLVEYTDFHVLRRGTSSWGYTHIFERHGWNPEMERCIGETIRNYTRTAKAGTSRTYYLDYSDFEYFKVVYEFGSGNKGVITAYSNDWSGHDWVCTR